MNEIWFHAAKHTVAHTSANQRKNTKRDHHAHNLKVVGSNPTHATTSSRSGYVIPATLVDTPKSGVHDNGTTKSGLRQPGRKVVRVKFSSAQVPIYEGSVRGAARFTISFYQNDRRVRRTFDSLVKATGEARRAAMKIHGGHPEGMEYRAVNEAPAVELTFGEIVWPDNLVLPWKPRAEIPQDDSADAELRRRFGEPFFVSESKDGESSRVSGLNESYWAGLYAAESRHACVRRACPVRRHADAIERLRRQLHRKRRLHRERDTDSLVRSPAIAA